MCRRADLILRDAVLRTAPQDEEEKEYRLILRSARSARLEG
jgi:hypothetical protein